MVEHIKLRCSSAIYQLAAAGDRRSCEGRVDLVINHNDNKEDNNY